MPSRPARGAWIEIFETVYNFAYTESRPARGAWIEIEKAAKDLGWFASRPARGAWIEISMTIHLMENTKGRAPQGARGLKFRPTRRRRSTAVVAPRKGRVD